MAKKAAKRKPSRGSPEVTLSLPVSATLGDGYMRHRLQTRLTPAAKRGLRRLFDGLVASGSTLENGKPVEHPDQALRYLLEQIDRAAVEAAGPHTDA